MTLAQAEEELALQEARENDAWELYLSEVAKTRAARVIRNSLLVITAPEPEELKREHGGVE